MNRYWSIFLLPLLLLPLFLPAQELSRKEQKMVQYLDARTPEAIDLLERLVNINSGTMNHAGVREVGRMLEPEFQALGFETKWHEMPDSLNRAGHLFAYKKGTTGKRLLLIGHLDTVFPKDSPFQTFDRFGKPEDDSYSAKGPGAADMKGGDVIILYALKALEEAGLLKDATITVALIGDEEKSGKPLSISRKHLIEAGKNSDIALGFEGGDPGKAVVARRSAGSWALTTTGIRKHSSQIFQEGVGSGAIFEAARILHAFHEEVRGEEYLTFNAGAMVGGTFIQYDPSQNKGTAFGKTNVVPQAVTVHGGLRCISLEQITRAQTHMQKIATTDNLPGTSAEITFIDSYPPMSPTSENHEVLAVYDQASRDLGYETIEPHDPSERGAADISFVAFIPALGGLGCYGSGAHTPEEVVNLKAFDVQLKKAAVLLGRLVRE